MQPELLDEPRARLSPYLTTLESEPSCAPGPEETSPGTRE